MNFIKNPVVIFLKENTPYLDVHIEKTQQIIFTGQIKWQKNDHLFQINENRKIIIFMKKHTLWTFVGIGRVISQSQQRIIHKIQPLPPKWVLKYKNPTEFQNWNSKLEKNYEKKYISKENIFNFLYTEIGYKPIVKNSTSVGIVEIFKC